ncbi:hypothetical protein [Sphingomonas sp. G-3-2-10]|uniref:hypothetical protein n=1 Tax=Sphingomonas sp. G-3-2-10 TaxID=2728838 RepID=UPI00146B2AA4|nr:hypothetical protein [Sphingomonas sp. G-3-2-10]NML07623.1 hypothetical protein [Sphingomonas sp. G-3-2-10]
MTTGQPNDALARRRAIRLDLVVAVALALILTIGWTLTDWGRLSRMLLPDPDDMMRIAQVRDWIAGQGINDWTQYRMAPPEGSPMHWSRINDVGIAALILLATPFAGQAGAEMFAVLVYPALLFALALFLSARIARRLWGPSAGPIAAVLMALAYPGTTVFIPGRIDHHALQVVLIQIFVLLLMRTPTLKGGILTGLAAGLSLVIGLETAPQVAALVAVLAMLWVVRGMNERSRLTGFAAGLGVSTLFFLTFLRPTFWSPALCDAFTPASSTGTLAVAAALGALAATTPRLASWQVRIATGALLGAVSLGLTLYLFPSCISGPYGEMDPFLLKAFMPYIDEANSVFEQPRLARIIAIGGVLAAACITSAWMIWRAPKRWAVLLPIAAVILMSGLIMLLQVRGAYIGAPLGAPVLAGLVVAARARTTWQLPAVIGAWLAGAGMAYATIPEQIELRVARDTSMVNRPTLQVVCSGGDAWAQVDRFKPGVVMAGTNVAAYLMGATHHSTIGAGYHRNNTGNMAMYRFFLSKPDEARAIAAAWKTDYVAFCPGDFVEIDVTRNYPDSMATRLQHGQAPAWLQPMPLKDTPLRFYRIVR